MNLKTAEMNVVNDDPVPDISSDEIKNALKDMKRGKAPGGDEVLIGYLKEGGEPVCRQLAVLFTECMTRNEIPSSWNNAVNRAEILRYHFAIAHTMTLGLDYAIKKSLSTHRKLFQVLQSDTHYYGR